MARDAYVTAMAVDPNTGLPTSQIALDCNGNNTFVGEIFNNRLTESVANGSANPFAAMNPNGMCGFPIVNAGGKLNVFPTVDPLAARLSAFWPTPNTSIAGNNFLSDPRRRQTRNNFDIRIDHKISDKDNAFGRFSYEDQPSFIPPPFNNVLDGGGFFDGIEDNSYRSLALSETHLFKSSLFNDFRVGYNRINSHQFHLTFYKHITPHLDFPST